MRLLFNVFQTIDSVNTTNDFGAIMVYANNISGNFLINGLLVMAFIIAFVGSYFSTSRLRGRGDIIASFAAAGFLTFGLSLVFSLREGLIQTSSILVCLVIAILGFLWLVFSKDR